MNCCRLKRRSQTGGLPFVDGATPPPSPQGSVITDKLENFTSSIRAVCPIEEQPAEVQEPPQASSVSSNRTSNMATIKSPHFRAKAKESVSAALLTSFVPISTLVGSSLSLPQLTVTVLDAVWLPQAAEEVVELFATAVADQCQAAERPLTKARSISLAQQFVEKLQDKLRGFYARALMAITVKVRGQMPEESCPETATLSVSNRFLDTTTTNVVQSMLSTVKDISEGKVCLDNISAVGSSGKFDDGNMEVSEAEICCFTQHICHTLLENMKPCFATRKPAKVSPTGHDLTRAKEALSQILVAVRDQDDNAQLKALAGAMLTKIYTLPEDQNNGADNKEEVESLTLSVATSETLKADSTFSLEGRRLEGSSCLSQLIAEVGSQGFSPDNFSAMDPSSDSGLDMWKPPMVPAVIASFSSSSSSSSSSDETWLGNSQEIVVDRAPSSDSGVDTWKPYVVVPSSDTGLTDSSSYTPSRDTVTTSEDVSTDSSVEAMQEPPMVPAVRPPSFSEIRLEKNQESLTDSSFYTPSRDTVSSEDMSTDSCVPNEQSYFHQVERLASSSDLLPSVSPSPCQGPEERFGQAKRALQQLEGRA